MRALLQKFAGRPQQRTFACLDEHGICRAFHQSAQPPGPAGWHEVTEQRLNWLGARLPKSAFTSR